MKIAGFDTPWTVLNNMVEGSEGNCGVMSKDGMIIVEKVELSLAHHIAAIPAMLEFIRDASGYAEGVVDDAEFIATEGLAIWRSLK